jgi:hypothetical protein
MFNSPPKVTIKFRSQKGDLSKTEISRRKVSLTIKALKKVANRTSHRYNRLPLLPSDPGGVQQELVVLACRCKYTTPSLHNCKSN